MPIAVILAAGSSRRMGAANKLLLPWKDTNVLGTVIETVKSSGLEKPIVVTGHEALLVERVARAYGCGTAHNADFDTGMNSSIRAGLKAARASGATHALIIPGDIPRICADTFRNAIEFSQNEPDCIWRAMVGDTPSHPVVIPLSLIDEGGIMDGDNGLRDVFSKNRLPVKTFTGAAGDIVDVDDRAAYDSASKKI